MKKLSLLFASVIAINIAAHAQKFGKATNIVGAGIGFGSSLGSFGSGNQTPAASFHYERGVWEAGSSGIVSLGAYFGIKNYTYNQKYASFNYHQKLSYKVIGIRGAYHYLGIPNDKIDVYAGAMLSYNIVSYKYSTDDPYETYHYTGSYGSAAGVTAFVGARYLITKNLAAFAEAGYGVSYFTIGLAYKF